jgi:hypothetical protein
MVVFLGLFLASALPLSSSMAAAKPGGKCPTLNKTTTIKSGGITKQYKCLVDYYGDNTWILQKPSLVKSVPKKSTSGGYWTTSCITTEVPNPNYDGRPTDSRGHIQWPTIKTQQCSQIWIQK